jgi:hypothetical protein
MAKRIVHSLLVLAFLLTPATVTSLVLARQLNATLLDCKPNYGVMGRSDEMHYWEEIHCFQHVGFGGGYFVVNERPAPASWTHFGPHGPAFPVVYGSLARVFGWRLESGPCFNIGFLMLGSAAWLWFVRPTTQQLLTAILLTMSFWPSILFIPAMLQESFHCAVAFALAGLAHRSINHNDPRVWSFVVLVALVSLMRVTWALLLIPWALLAMSGMNKLARIAVFSLVPALFLLWGNIASPYPNILDGLSWLIRVSPASAWDRYCGHVGDNIFRCYTTFTSPIDWSSLTQAFEGSLQNAERGQVLAIFLLAGLAAVQKFHRRDAIQLAVAMAIVIGILIWRRLELIGGITIAGFALWRQWPRLQRRTLSLTATAAAFGLILLIHQNWDLLVMLGRNRVLAIYAVLLMSVFIIYRQTLAKILLPLTEAVFPKPADSRPYLFAGLNMALITLTVFLVYDVKHDRDYRVLAPHLLLSMLLFISGPAYRAGLVVIAIGLLATPDFAPAFARRHYNRVEESESIDLSPYMTYDPARSAWANTLLVPNMQFRPIIRVPAGIGVSTIVENEEVMGNESEQDRIRRAPRSRYLLLDSLKIDEWKQWHLELVHVTPHGVLFINRDCE